MRGARNKNRSPLGCRSKMVALKSITCCTIHLTPSLSPSSFLCVCPSLSRVSLSHGHQSQSPSSACRPLLCVRAYRRKSEREEEGGEEEEKKRESSQRLTRSTLRKNVQRNNLPQFLSPLFLSPPRFLLPSFPRPSASREHSPKPLKKPPSTESNFLKYTRA